MMIDIFNHFMPKAYLDRLGDLIPGHPMLTAFPRLKTLWDVDARRALLDEFGETRHVLSLANPPPELIGPPDKIRHDLDAWQEAGVTSLLIAGSPGLLRQAAEIVLG